MNRLQQLRDLLKEDPQDAFLQYAIAVEMAANGQLNEAIHATKTLLQQQPDYLGAYYQLGKWLESAGNTNEAILTYQEGIRIATTQKKNKTLNELKEALWQLEE